MIELHLYGKLRRFTGQQAATGDSVLSVPWREGDSIGDILTRLGVPHDETSNIFVNGELCALSKTIQDGQRVGVFPDDMALLYKWYFPKKK
jgi:hypothetical protein